MKISFKLVLLCISILLFLGIFAITILNIKDNLEVKKTKLSFWKKKS